MRAAGTRDDMGNVGSEHDALPDEGAMLRNKLVVAMRRKRYHDWLALLDTLKHYAKPHHVILELGASTASRTIDLSRLARTVIGVELHLERVPKLGRAHPRGVSYLCADAQHLASIKTASCDIVVASHLIEHVSDDLAFLQSIYRVLRPGGGYAILTTPNRKRLVRSIIELFTGERRFTYWEHQREYVRCDLEDLLKRSPFEEYTIHGLVFGIHGGPMQLYLATCPVKLQSWAEFGLLSCLNYNIDKFCKQEDVEAHRHMEEAIYRQAACGCSKHGAPGTLLGVSSGFDCRHHADWLSGADMVQGIGVYLARGFRLADQSIALL
jgi:SAM-dependent methyltransferase